MTRMYDDVVKEFVEGWVLASQRVFEALEQYGENPLHPDDPALWDLAVELGYIEMESADFDLDPCICPSGIADEMLDLYRHWYEWDRAETLEGGAYNE